MTNVTFVLKEKSGEKRNWDREVDEEVIVETSIVCVSGSRLYNRLDGLVSV
jgi:hypothetical protein